jgi:hypothetical protein
MSNPLAVATVTEVVAALVDAGAKTAVDDFSVFTHTGRPDEVDEDDGNAHVNLFLYQVMPNTALRNEHLPARRGDGSLVQRPVAAVDLRYLVTFFGDPGRRVPERLLGGTLAALHTQPVLSSERIRQVIQAEQGSKPFLALSDLADQVERVRLTPVGLNLEELSKLWSVFFQVPYSLSYAFEASVVLLEAPGGSPQAALPVRGPAPPDGRDGRRLYVAPFRHPRIDEAAAEGGPQQPIVTGTTLALRGADLLGETTRVILAGETVGALPVEPRPDLILVPLQTPPVPATALRAGVVGVQVVHDRAMGDPETPHPGVSSNVAAFVLRPRVTGVSAQNVQPTGATRSADLVVDFDPPVGKRQRVVLLLNELDVASPPAPPPGRPPRAHRFDAPSRDLPAEPDSRTQLTIPIAGVHPDDYLVRVQVDGAESPLALGSLPATPAIQQYVSPQVTLP